MTKLELQQEYPDLYSEIHNEGVMEERKRIQLIEELVIPGSEDFLAKYKFEEPKAASEVSILMMKAIKNGEFNTLADPSNQQTKESEIDTGAKILNRKSY